MAQSYNFPSHRAGDTFPGVQFTLELNGSPLDLTGAQALMQLRRAPNVRHVEAEYALTVSDAAQVGAPSGVIRFPAQIIDLPPHTYYYDIELRLADGTVKTYIHGQWPITQTITR